MELKEIPGTLGFLADEFGNIYNPDLTKRNTYKNGDGYVTVGVKTTNDKWVTFGVMRKIDSFVAIYFSKENALKLKAYIEGPANI